MTYTGSMTTPVDIGTLIVTKPGYAGGKPHIQGTGITVISVGLFAQDGEAAEQIISEHYPQLSLAQVYAALAYFHVNRAEIDAILDEEERNFREGEAAQHTAADRR